MGAEIFQLLVGYCFGNELLAFIGIAIIYAVILLFGRCSLMLMFMILSVYFLIFGTLFYGPVFFILVFITSGIYFAMAVYKFIQGVGD